VVKYVQSILLHWRLLLLLVMKLNESSTLIMRPLQLPGQGHCVCVLGQDTLLLQCISPPRVPANSIPSVDKHLIQQGGVEMLLVASCY